MYSNGTRTQLIFHGPVSSGEGKWLWLYTRDVPEGSAWSQKHFVARFLEGSLAGFAGRVSCYQYAPAYADVRGPNDIMTELVSDTDTIPGTIELGYNCRIGAETAESVVSVGTIAFKENSGFGVTYDGMLSELVRGANFKVLGLKDVTVEGVDGVLLRNYGPSATIETERVKGVVPVEERTAEPFKVKAV